MSGSNNFLTGVYGAASNSGTAPAYAGYFEGDVKVNGSIIVGGVKQVYGTFTSTTDGDQFIDLSSKFSIRCIGGIIGGINILGDWI